MRNVLLTVAGIALMGCTQMNQQETLALVDMTQDYPEKEIALESVADLRLVRFEAPSEEYLFDGVPVVVSESLIVFHSFQRGDFWVFDGAGKPISAFNHKGNGPEDYLNLFGVVYDEAAKELFLAEKNKVKVFDTQGRFKRLLRLPENAWIDQLINYDAETLLLFDNQQRLHGIYPAMPPVEGEAYESSFVRISKQDGTLKGYLPAPADFEVPLMGKVQMPNGQEMPVLGTTSRIVAHREGVLLNNPESDTLCLAKGDALRPVWVTTPPIRTQGEPKSYLNGYVEAGGYRFFEVISLAKVQRPPLPTTYLAQEIKSGDVICPVLQWGDYTGKELHLSPMTIFRSRNARLGHQVLPLDELQEALETGKLKGNLKTLVEQMGEEENDLLLLMRFK